MAWLKSTFPVLFDSAMPVWLTLIVGVLAAIGTYFLAPVLNRRIEVDKSKSQHVADSTKSLNENFVDLSCTIRQMISALFENSSYYSEKKESCLDIITVMQWKIVDLKIILRKRDLPLADKLAKALTELRHEIQTITAESYQDLLLDKLEQTSSIIVSILDRLYKHAKLK
jgi:hypothetical protein